MRDPQPQTRAHYLRKNPNVRFPKYKLMRAYLAHCLQKTFPRALRQSSSAEPDPALQQYAHTPPIAQGRLREIAPGRSGLRRTDSTAMPLSL